MSAERPKLALVFALSACGWMPESDTTTVHASSGALCLTSNPDGSVDVVVSLGTCLSSSCDRLLAASCQISEADGTITVTSRAEIQHGGTECTADCGVPTTRCGSPPIAPGTYTVIYGLHTADLTLPATQAKLFSERAQVVTCPDPD